MEETLKKDISDEFHLEMNNLGEKQTHLLIKTNLIARNVKYETQFESHCNWIVDLIYTPKNPLTRMRDHTFQIF